MARPDQELRERVVPIGGTRRRPKVKIEEQW